MGYRSDVAIQIYGDQDKMQELIAFHDSKLETLEESAKEDYAWLLVYSKENTSKEFWNVADIIDEVKQIEVIFYVDSVKWYSENPSVNFINSLYGKAEELGLSGEFLRIGDDTSDVEENCIGDNCEWRMSINRSIDIGFC